MRMTCDEESRDMSTFCPEYIYSIGDHDKDFRFCVADSKFNISSKDIISLAVRAKNVTNVVNDDFIDPEVKQYNFINDYRRMKSESNALGLPFMGFIGALKRFNEIYQLSIIASSCFVNSRSMMSITEQVTGKASVLLEWEQKRKRLQLSYIQQFLSKYITYDQQSYSLLLQRLFGTYDQPVNFFFFSIIRRY